MGVINNTIAFRRKRLQSARPKPAPPTTGPVLIAATWNAESSYVQLQFDRAIDASGREPTAIVVDDQAETGLKFEADGGITIVNPTTVRLGMESTSDAVQTGVHLTATTANGIVSADDDEAWSGVSDLS